MINGRDIRVSEGLPRRCPQPPRNWSEALFHTKTFQNADDVVQKSTSQVSEAKTKGQRPKIESEGPKTKAQRPKTKAQNLKTKAQRQSLSGPRLPKTIQNADDVVQKSMSQVSETNLPGSCFMGGGLTPPTPPI